MDGAVTATAGRQFQSRTTDAKKELLYSFTEPDLMTSCWCSRGCKISLYWNVGEMVDYSEHHDGLAVLPM